MTRREKSGKKNRTRERICQQSRQLYGETVWDHAVKISPPAMKTVCTSKWTSHSVYGAVDAICLCLDCQSKSFSVCSHAFVFCNCKFPIFLPPWSKFVLRSWPRRTILLFDSSDTGGFQFYICLLLFGCSFSKAEVPYCRNLGSIEPTHTGNHSVFGGFGGLQFYVHLLGCSFFKAEVGSFEPNKWITLVPWFVSSHATFLCHTLLTFDPAWCAFWHKRHSNWQRCIVAFGKIASYFSFSWVCGFQQPWLPVRSELTLFWRHMQFSLTSSSETGKCQFLRCCCFRKTSQYIQGQRQQLMHMSTNAVLHNHVKRFAACLESSCRD